MSDPYEGYSQLDSHNLDSNKPRINHIPFYKKKKFTFCGCLLFFLISFLLCFFLIPRDPSVYLKYIEINNTTLYGKFNFKNNNYYQMKWKNPDIGLYWIPYNNEDIGKICYGDDDGPCESDYYFNNICAIKIGMFQSDLIFNTKARSTKNINIEMIHSDQQEIACSTWMLFNSYQYQAQRLITIGHINADSGITNYGNVKVKESYYYL
jgi:hypothetical protein